MPKEEKRRAANPRSAVERFDRMLLGFCVTVVMCGLVLGFVALVVAAWRWALGV